MLVAELYDRRWIPVEVVQGVQVDGTGVELQTSENMIGAPRYVLVLQIR